MSQPPYEPYKDVQHWSTQELMDDLEVNAPDFGLPEELHDEILRRLTFAEENGVREA